jgi:hypothetical protein
MASSPTATAKNVMGDIVVAMAIEASAFARPYG